MSPGVYDPHSLDHDTCIKACGYRGYSYAALQDGMLCLCSDSNYNPTNKEPDESSCDNSCSGDSTQDCGSGNYVLVYHIIDTVMAAIQLDPVTVFVVGTSASVNTDSVSGSNLKYLYDFGDGTALSEDNTHTYTAQGDYIMSLTVQNDISTDSDALPIHIRSQPVSGVTLTCPERAGVSQEFECIIEILHGNDLQVTPTFGMGPGAVTEPAFYTEMPMYLNMGHVSQDPAATSLPSDDIHLSGYPVFWVIPGTETLTASKLITLEAFITIAGDGTLSFVVYQPVCQSPSDVYCPVTNTCINTLACSYDFTLPTNPTQQDTCTTAEDVFCLLGSRCVNNTDVDACPAKPARYQTDALWASRAAYRVVEIVALSGLTTGHLYHTLATPINMDIGNVLGIRISAAGAKVGYERTLLDSPVEFQHAGTDYTVMQDISIGVNSSHQIHHHVRGTVVIPAEVMIQHAFDVPNIYYVNASVSNPYGVSIEVSTTIAVQELLTGLTAEVDNDILLVGGTVAAYAKITGGKGVNYTWDWGDGSEDFSVRQALNYSDADMMTHTYNTDGTFIITITAIDYASNETVTVMMYVQYPINRNHYVMTSNTPQPHPGISPGTIEFTVTINLTPGEDLGTATMFAVSTSFFENSTLTALSINSDGQSEPFTHDVQFSGKYEAVISLSNKISVELYTLQIDMIEPITGFYLEPMYQPPLPVDGPEQIGLGPLSDTFPLNSPVIFVPRFDTGTGISYSINYGDGTPLDAVTGDKIPHLYSALGTYVISIAATNYFGIINDGITIYVQENIDGIQISELQTTTANETKDFDITVSSLGTSSCLVIDYGDNSQEIFGSQALCENHVNYPTATWIQQLTSSFRASHVYTTLGSFQIKALGFNLVSDTSAQLFFAVTEYSCNCPKLFIRDGHPDWRGPRITYFSQFLQIQGVTNVECESYKNYKVWKMEEINPNTGFTIPGTAVELTGLPPTHRYYLSDADTAEINILPRTIPTGTWKFKYTVHMEQDVAENVEYLAYVNEYIQVQASPLKVQIFEGQTTSMVVGHGQVIQLKPGVLSFDPDLPDDVTEKNFTSIGYFCRRLYEPWELDNKRNIKTSPKIPIGVANFGEVNEGGCFGTGNGLLDHEGDILELDSALTLANMTYVIMVIITKESRLGNATVFFTVKSGNPPQSSMSLGGGTLYQPAFASLLVNPTDDFRLQASCDVGCTGTVYQWEVDYFTENGSIMPVNNWEQHATGILTDSLYMNKDVFAILPDVQHYLFTIHVTNAAAETGKAHIRISLNQPPEGGYCTITPTEAKTDDIVQIICSDWKDEHGIASYEFFIKVEGSVNKILGFGSLPLIQFYSPLGKVEDDYQVTFGVQIDDVHGATTIATIGSIMVKENINASEFLSEESTAKIETVFNTLAAEGNSRAINSMILIESSRLNDLHLSEELALTESNVTATENTISGGEVDPRVYEAERTKRAYWRNNMAELQTETSIDSIWDVLHTATVATVLTEVTNELSHQALSSMTKLGGKMVNTVQLMAQNTDQKTVIQTVEAMFECFTNVLEGSAYTIIEPLRLLDQHEAANSAGGYPELNRRIEEEMSFSEDVSQLTTTDTISSELNAEKEQKAHTVVAQTNLLLTAVANILKQNMVPREPPIAIMTQSASMTVSRTNAASAIEMTMNEGDGQFNLPDWCSLKGRGGGSCDENEIIDVQSNSYKTNHYNYMDSSERISDKSSVMALKIMDSNGEEIPIMDTSEEIEVWIPRPNTETPQCVNYEQNYNTTSQSGMSVHTFNIPFDQTTVTLEVLPESFFSTQYGILVRYQHPPNRDEYDHMWIVPYNISLGANNSDYSVYLNESYISNNTGTYYLGIVEIPQSPQGDLPNILFDDNLSPKEILDDILRMDRSFNFTGNYTLCIYNSGCAYFNNQTHEWSTEGVRIGPNTTKDMTQCFTRHLTDFASTWIVPPTPLDFEYIFNNAGFLENLTIYITTIVIYVLFVFIFIWARRKDRKDIILQGLTPLADNKPNQKYLYEIAVMTGQWKGSGTESKVHFILSGEDDETEVRTFEDDKRSILQTGAIDRFVMAVPRPLGTLNYMRVWHDNSGKGAMQNWFVQYIAVRDLQTRQRYYFIANRWFSLVDDDGQVDRLLTVAGREQMQGFGHVFSSHTRKNLNDGHLWFSIFMRPVGSRFTRIQRTACCLMALWLEMLVNIMWYKVIPPAPSSSAINIGPFSMSPAQISIGIQSSIIVFPVTLLVVQIFRKARPRRKQKSHRRIIKEQQEELKKKYKVGNEDVVSENHIIMETKPTIEDNISTRSGANLLDNQTDDTPTVMINTTTSQTLQKPKKKKFSFPWWAVIIGWFLCLLSIAVATTFTIFYGIQFGDLVTKEWLTSLVVTFVTGILCTQPIKILLVALFVALIIKNPNADEEEEGVPEDEDNELGKDEMWLHDLSSPAQGKVAYKPPDPSNLERIREQRIKELKMYNILREICFYVVFLWTLMIVSYSNIDPYAFYMKDQYINILGHGDRVNRFEKIVGVKHFWKWVNTGLVPNLYADRWYNGMMDPTQVGYFSDRQSYILGKVVMRQVRIEQGLCDVHKKFEGIVPECNEEYSIFNQDTNDYGRAWLPVNNSDDTVDNYRYVSANDLDGYPFLGRHALYSGGGYVVLVEGSQSKMYQTFQQLYNETWIDKYTRAVFLEFSCYNPQVNLFAVVNFVTEFLQTGAGQTMQRIDVIRLLTYSEGFGLVRILCEVMFFCFIIFFIVKEVRNFQREKRRYFRNFWNWTECAIIGFSISAAVIYFYRMYISNIVIDMLKDGGYRYIKLQYVAYWNEILGYMLGWIVFLATLKFLKMLRFNRRIGILSSTIEHCSADLMYFGIMFAVVFFAFATAFYLIFSRNVYNYSDFIYTSESLLSAILGKFKFEELIIAERLLGPIFFFLFMGSMSYILINMFLTIINEAFKVVNTDISKQSNEYEMVDFMIRRLKLWTGIGKPPIDGVEKKPGDGGDEDGGLKKEPDIMDEFPEKVDQLLNSIAKIYFDHNSFNEVIRGRGQKGKKGKGSKKTISV